LYFPEPVAITFKFMNESYTMCVDKFESTNKDHAEVVKQPGILSASIVEDDTDVTSKLREIHGHTKNYYMHIPDTVKDLSIIGREKTLHIYDMMGNYIIHKI
jgi:hypothetical protein